MGICVSVTCGVRGIGSRNYWSRRFIVVVVVVVVVEGSIINSTTTKCRVSSFHLNGLID